MEVLFCPLAGNTLAFGHDLSRCNSGTPPTDSVGEILPERQNQREACFQSIRCYLVGLCRKEQAQKGTQRPSSSLDQPTVATDVGRVEDADSTYDDYNDAENHMLHPTYLCDVEETQIVDTDY